VILAHVFGSGLHFEYLLIGAAVAFVGVWMLRTRADARGGRVMIGIGILLGIVSLVA
jgi:hypothetical protein